MSDKPKKTNRYLQETGHMSRSGKSILIESKNGTKYYAKANQIKKEKRDPSQKGIWLNRKGDIKTRLKPICTDSYSESYMRYWEKKCTIRNEYPKWVHMSREQSREYFSRIWDLIQNDSDYLQWKEESKTLEERNKDLWWQEQLQKEKRYNGHNDEYEWE